MQTVNKKGNKERFITVVWSAEVMCYYLLLKLLHCKYEQLDTLLFVPQSLYGLLISYSDILEAK
jgi:hypothetical protein